MKMDGGGTIYSVNDSIVIKMWSLDFIFYAVQCFEYIWESNLTGGKKLLVVDVYLCDLRTPGVRISVYLYGVLLGSCMGNETCICRYVFKPVTSSVTQMYL